MSACAPLRPLPPVPAMEAAADSGEQTLSLQGQLSIKLQAFEDHAAKGVSLGFFFQGTPKQGQLDLMTPLGSQVARLHWTPGHATLLSTDRAEQEFDSLDELSQQVLGEALPLPALMAWLNGHPSPDLPPATIIDEHTFEQNGWRIGTAELAAGKLTADRPATDAIRGVTIRIRLDR